MIYIFVCINDTYQSVTIVSVSISEIGVGPDEALQQYHFLPVNAEWQRRVAGLLGTVMPTRCCYAETEMASQLHHQYPTSVKDVRGNGACLPRVLSMAIYGNENQHHRLRQAVVDFMLKGPLPEESSQRNAAFYKRMTAMRLRKTWMTTEEVRGFAYLLDTPIFTLVHNKNTNGRDCYYWQRIPHHLTKENVNNVRGIFILNAHNHFQLIMPHEPMNP